MKQWNVEEWMQYRNQAIRQARNFARRNAIDKRSIDSLILIDAALDAWTTAAEKMREGINVDSWERYIGKSVSRSLRLTANRQRNESEMFEELSYGRPGLNEVDALTLLIYEEKSKNIRHIVDHLAIDKNELCEALMHGVSMTQIAAEFNRHKGTISRIVAKLRATFQRSAL